MKKLTALLLALCMVFALAACGEDAETAESAAPSEEPAESAAPSEEPAESEEPAAESGFTTVEEGKLIMSTNAAFPPYETTDDSGAIIGIDPEIAALIAEKLNLELVIDDMDFDGALLAVQQGKADMVMAGVSITEDRLLVMDFTTPYAGGQQVVIVTEDSPITTLDDLEGKMIGCQRATTGYILASDTPENGGYGEDNVTAYDNGITAIQALQNGQVDAVIIDDGPAQEFVAANPGLKILDAPWADEQYAIGLSKEDSADALNEAINNALQELIDDGTVQSIMDKYITAE